MELGKKIQELRKINGMSQDYLAEKLGVSRQAISKWENGQTEPSSENLFKLAKLFKVTVEQLIHPNMRVELVMGVRKEIVDIKKNKKPLLFLICTSLLLFVGFFVAAVYGRISGNLTEQSVLYLILVSVTFMLLAFLPVIVSILQYVYRDCKERGIKPTFWVVISVTVIGLAYYLIRRDILSNSNPK